MHQVVQNLRSGKLSLLHAPDPLARPGHVLVATRASVISAGTERMALELARKSLLGKARARPDHVRRLVEKIRQEGLLNAVGQALNKLDEPAPLGYSSAGTVLAVGAGVQDLKPGDRVASNGPHAGVVVVPRHLCARIPDPVPFDQAAYGILGAIALQAVRLSGASLGDQVLVVGLGLLGQVACALLKAAGARVIGTDPDPARCALALRLGAETARPDLDPKSVKDLTRGVGADAVLITASTDSDQPVTLAGEAVRKKGRVVATGAVGLNLPRRAYYFSEAEFVVSCSYGPGRYDPDYEDRGRDYPVGYVRWTEQRNLQAVLDLMGSGKLDLSPLTTHRFPIENAEAAYALVDSPAPGTLGIVLTYPEAPAPEKVLKLAAAPAKGGVAVGVLGAGVYAKSTLLPALAKSGRFRPRILASAGGAGAAHAGEKFGFELVTADEEELFRDPELKAVFILTRHDLHARQVLRAIERNLAVFVEKPLALDLEQLAAIETALRAKPVPLVVGYNRRFAPSVLALKKHFEDAAGPKTISIRFNAGSIPAEHWTQDEKVGGGRLIGEACHAIDLATFLAGAPPVRVYAESVGGPQAPAVSDDQAFLTLRHADGSISSIAYLAGGDRAAGKERVEMSGGGSFAVLDDYQVLDLTRDGRTRREKFGGLDKGHAAELKAFGELLVQGGSVPIPWEELRAVSAAAILAVQSLREGAPFDIGA